MKEQPGKSRRIRWYLGATLLVSLPVSVLIWAAVERVRDAADRAH